MEPCEEREIYRCKLCGLDWNVWMGLGGGDSAANPKLYEEFHWSLHPKSHTQAYGRLIETPKAQARYWLELGHSLRRENRPQEAEAVWQSLLKKWPDHKECRGILIKLRLADGRCQEAPFEHRDWERVKSWAIGQDQGLLPAWRQVFWFYAGALLCQLDGRFAGAWLTKAIERHKLWLRWDPKAPERIRDITDPLEACVAHPSYEAVLGFRWGLFATVLVGLGQKEAIVESRLWSAGDSAGLKAAYKALMAFRRGGEFWEEAKRYIEKNAGYNCSCRAWLNWPYFPHYLDPDKQPHLAKGQTAYRCQVCGLEWVIERDDRAWLPLLWRLKSSPAQS